MRTLLTFLLAAFASLTAIAQEIDNSSSLLDVGRTNFVRICYDNDLFVGTDQYYTQGIGVDYFHGRLKKNPLNVLLLGLSSSKLNKYGIQFRTHGCTPTSILSDRYPSTSVCLNRKKFPTI